jgi:hypothetical protein
MVFDVEVPGAAPSPDSNVPTVGAGKTIRLGMHDITYYPPENVSVETSPDGGTTMRNTGPEGEYAMVTIDEDTTFYLASGESVVFGPEGAVIRTDGVVHLEAPLSVTSFYFDPVKDPAGSSFTGNAIK